MLMISLLVMMLALVVMLIMPWRWSVLELCQETKNIFRPFLVSSSFHWSCQFWQSSPGNFHICSNENHDLLSSPSFFLLLLIIIITMIIFSLLLLMLSILIIITQVRGVPARVAAGGGSRQLPHPRHHLSHQVGHQDDHEDDGKDQSAES